MAADHVDERAETFPRARGRCSGLADSTLPMPALSRTPWRSTGERRDRVLGFAVGLSGPGFVLGRWCRAGGLGALLRRVVAVLAVVVVGTSCVSCGGADRTSETQRSLISAPDAGHEGNELADQLATRGAIEFGGSTGAVGAPKQRGGRRPNRRRR